MPRSRARRTVLAAFVIVLGARGGHAEPLPAATPFHFREGAGNVASTLRAHHALTGENIGRDPEAWAGWFATTYGSRVDLAPGSFEALVVIRPETGSCGEARSGQRRIATASTRALEAAGSARRSATDRRRGRR